MGNSIVTIFKGNKHMYQVEEPAQSPKKHKKNMMRASTPYGTSEPEVDHVRRQVSPPTHGHFEVNSSPEPARRTDLQTSSNSNGTADFDRQVNYLPHSRVDHPVSFANTSDIVEFKYPALPDRCAAFSVYDAAISSQGYDAVHPSQPKFDKNCQPERSPHSPRKSGAIENNPGSQADLNDENEKLKERLKESEARNSRLSGKVDELSGKVDELSGKVDELSGKVVSLGADRTAAIRSLIISELTKCSFMGSETKSDQTQDFLKRVVVKEHKKCADFIRGAMPSMQLSRDVFNSLRYTYSDWKRIAEELYGDASKKDSSGHYPLEKSYHEKIKEMFALLNRRGTLLRNNESGGFRPDYMVVRDGIGTVTDEEVKFANQSIQDHRYKDFNFPRPPTPSQEDCVSFEEVFEWVDKERKRGSFPKNFECEVKALGIQKAHPELIYSVIEIKRLDAEAVNTPVVLPFSIDRRGTHEHINHAWYQVIGRAFTRCVKQQVILKDLIPECLPFIGAFTDGSNFVCMKVEMSEEFIDFTKCDVGLPPEKMFQITHRLCKLNSKEAALYVALLSNFGCGKEFLFRGQAESRIDFHPQDPEPIYSTKIGEHQFQVVQELHVGQQLVHLAKDPNNNPVVLKSSLLNSKGIAREKWMLEYLASKHVRGIPTVTFYGPGSLGQNTMALSPVGKDMDFFVGRQIQIDLCHISQSLKRTLSQIHEQGIVHSDVKPSNVLLTQQQNEVILIDFNLAVRKGECRAGYTAMFGSVNACLEGKPDFQDDWESLFYTLAYAEKGGDLPWMLDYGKVHENSLEMKRTLLRELSVSLPTWIVPLKEHLDSVLEQLPNPNQDAQQTVMNVMQNVIAYSEATRNESQFFDE
jgi:hypothetical protein